MTTSFSEPNPDDVYALLNSMRGRRIAVIGDLMLDAYLIGEVDRISPEAPVPVLEMTDQNYMLGGAANVAQCLAALGADVRLCGVVGNDTDGRRLADVARRVGIAVDDIVLDAGRPTTSKTRVVARSQQFIRLDRESRVAISGDVERQLIDRARELSHWADAVMLSDYAKGVLTGAMCRATIESAADTPVVIDPKALPWDRFRGATLIKPNWHEAQPFAGFSVEDDASAFLAASHLAEDLQITHAVITRGAAGMSLASRRRDGRLEPFHFAACPRELVDVTGAGDIVSAVLALALAVEIDPPLAVWLANAAAGVKVGKFGAAAVSPAELLRACEVPQGCRSRVVSREQAARLASGWRQQGKRVVFTNGCFDLLHVGHVHLLERSRALGDALVVGINSDDSVRELKGPTRPVQSEADRAQIAAAQASVDAVVVFDEPTPYELIRAIRPNVITKGADYRTKQAVVGWDFVQDNNGQVVLIDLVEGCSTTNLIRKAA